MPIIYKGPIDKKRMLPYSGIAQFANNFETTPPPPVIPFETPADRKRKRREKMEKLNTERNELLLSDWDPHSNPKATE